ncbi:MAG: TIGR01777 family oxidoreductase [Myxococcota bacterium]
MSRIAISGATGLVGRALEKRLTGEGHIVLRLVRRREQAVDDEHVYFGIDEGVVDKEKLQDLDALVHLAGENVGGGRWTTARKSRIMDSRKLGTRTLARAVAELSPPPKVVVGASAVGYYGNTGDRVVDESGPRGAGFLADVCEEWEAAWEPAEVAGVRVVKARIGVVLASEGGALEKMLPPFRLGLGGPLGNGRQWMSWITLEDVVRALHRSITDERLSGPVNVVAPSAVTNDEFTRSLGKALGRPTFFRVPGAALRVALGGEMASEMLLGGSRVEPKKLTDLGFEWAHPDLAGALQDVLDD